MSILPEPQLLSVDEDEAQIMRLFGVEEGSRAEEQLVEASASGPEALANVAGQLLGNQLLDPAWVELVDSNDVKAMGGISDYLKAGYDPPQSALEALEPALGSAPRRVLLALSRAFAGKAASLAPAAGIAPLIAVSLLHTPEAAIPMAADEPAPVVAQPDTPAPKPAKSDARVSGMIAMVALLAAAGLTALVVWVGG